MFAIQSLHDNTSIDTQTVLTDLGLAVQIFNQLFNKNRYRLTYADWNRIFPYQGNYYNQLKLYLSQHIFYNTDLGNIYPFTQNFANENGISMNNLQSELTTERNQNIPGAVNLFGGLFGTTLNPITGQYETSVSLPFLIVGGVILFAIFS